MNIKSTTLFLSGSLILLSLTFCTSKDETPTLQVSNSAGYLGPKKCMECHQDHFNNFMTTSHAKTTQKANEKTLPPIFEEPHNFFMLPKNQVMRLERDGQFFVERVYVNNHLVKTMHFDITLGSGKIGQNYIAQYNQQLFLLTSHFLKKSNSLSLRPGQPLSDTDFHAVMPVYDACLQCHTTYVEKQKWYPEFSLEGYPEWQFREKHRLKKNYILGVSCESCHGPGRDHVVQMLKNPNDPDVKIVHPAKLSRKRQMHVCAYCHSGIGNPIKPMFSFRPGDDLNDFFKFDQNTLKDANPHSNNVVLLEKSECFKKSNMTCTTCHNVHRQERGNKELFSLRCLKCHSVKDHMRVSNANGSFRENCIDCHMPMKEWEHKYITNKIKEESVSFRTHHIQIPKVKIIQPKN